MSDAKVSFETIDWDTAEPGKEQLFGFACPKHKGRRCEGLAIHGRTGWKHDPNGKNGGAAHWHWNGDRTNPTFTPSVNCGNCWHGFIENGRCISCSKTDEPEPQ